MTITGEIWVTLDTHPHAGELGFATGLAQPPERRGTPTFHVDRRARISPTDPRWGEHELLVPLAGQRSFQQEARVSRIVAEDYLVSLATNRCSVPFRLISQRVEVQRRGDTVHIFRCDREVATHLVLPGTHQFASCRSTAPGRSHASCESAAAPEVRP